MAKYLHLKDLDKYNFKKDVLKIGIKKKIDLTVEQQRDLTNFPNSCWNLSALQNLPRTPIKSLLPY